MKRLILEMGTGNDLYGEDHTKAAVRAIQDALHHSSLTLFRSLDLDREAMRVTVTIGVPDPDKLDHEMLARQIPYGTVEIISKKGGLKVEDIENDICTIVAVAGVEAWYDVPVGKYQLAK